MKSYFFGRTSGSFSSPGDRCTLINEPNSSVCSACGSQRSGTSDEVLASECQELVEHLGSVKAISMDGEHLDSQIGLACFFFYWFVIDTRTTKRRTVNHSPRWDVEVYWVFHPCRTCVVYISCEVNDAPMQGFLWFSHGYWTILCVRWYMSLKDLSRQDVIWTFCWGRYGTWAPWRSKLGIFGIRSEIE